MVEEISALGLRGLAGTWGLERKEVVLSGALVSKGSRAAASTVCCTASLAQVA